MLQKTVFFNLIFFSNFITHPSQTTYLLDQIFLLKIEILSLYSTASVKVV